MPLVNAKCTNSGANLKVDSSKDAAICEFCGSAYIVEKAINNYNITNNHQINANVVNIYSKINCAVSSDFEIVAGKLIEYTGSSIDVVIPESVHEIGINVFAGMRLLHSVILPSGITKIGKGAFYGCKNLESVIIPNSVKSIDGEAFAWCESLEQIHLSDGIEHIGYAAFCNCTSLTELIIPDSVRSIECLNPYDSWVGVVDNCSSLEDIKYPSRFGLDTFRGSLYFQIQQTERQLSIDVGLCPDHNLKLSFFTQKCPKCGKNYIRGSY